MTETVSSSSSSEEYETDVGAIEASMMKICSELKPHLEQGRYGLLVGDDTSGRLPALIVKGFADSISKTQNQKRPGLVFIQGGSHGTYPEVNNQVQEKVLSHRDEIGEKRVLIVTDYVQLGKTINHIIKPLRQAGIAFDIAALVARRTYNPQKGDYVDLPFDLNGGLLFDGLNREHYSLGDPGAPAIYARTDLSGLSGAEPHQPVSVLPRNKSDEKVSGARRDVKRMVSRIINRFYGSSTTSA